jgi:enoyl-CoA hydratase/carnithine racemase
MRGAGEENFSVGMDVFATMGTPDQRGGIQAFLEKRKPRFNRESESN